MLLIALLDFLFFSIPPATCVLRASSSSNVHVLNRLLFRLEGMKKDGYYLYDGSLHDVYIYGMTKDEYIEKYIVKGENNGL